MPDEEMEIMTDFGPEGFAEDIDIDLDLVAAGNQDEDLELADFDHSTDLHNFNSDGRDELMAERDDASYGMVDADDIGQTDPHHLTAQDIEIDLGVADNDASWPQDSTSAAQSQPINEIDFVDVGESNLEPNTDGDGDGVAVADQTFDPASNPTKKDSETAIQGHIDSPSAVIQSAVTTTTGISDTGDVASKSTDLLSGSNEHQESLGTAEFEASEETKPEGAAGVHQNFDLEEARENGATDNHDDFEYQDDQHAQQDDVDQSYQHASSGPLDEKINQETSEEITHDMGQVSNTAEESELGFNQDEQVPAQYTDEAQAPAVPEADWDEEHQDAAVQDGRDPSVLEIDDNQGGEGDAESYEEQNEEPFEESGHDDVDASSDVYGHPGHTETIHKGENETNTRSPQDLDDHSTSKDLHASPRDLFSLITRHALVISYGQTDYRLFSESDDDDPNTFFLDDTSALEVTLDKFLLNLREVIAEEISPLDELLIHIDGLGLEFSESSSDEFLKAHTFGELFLLHNRLVANDEDDAASPFYSYLMVRPNCGRRLIALQESARSGRGLSEVAVYRESTPEQKPGVQYDPSVSEFSSFDDDHIEAHGTEQDNSGIHDDVLEQPNREADGDDSSTHHPAEEPNQPEQVAEIIISAAAEDGDLADDYYEELDLSLSKQDDPATWPLNGDEPPLGENEADLEVLGTESATQHATASDEPSKGQAQVSANSSATATADDFDEIGYSDDEEDANTGDNKEAAPMETKQAPAMLEVPADDEITWESENEDSKADPKSAVSTETVQVSPSLGKRTRPESAELEGGSEQNGVKRQRS